MYRISSVISRCNREDAGFVNSSLTVIKMTVAIDSSFRGWASHHNHNNVNPAITLEDKYEIVKEVGDGSFGSVVLGRTRSAGATVVRRNTMVCEQFEARC